MDEGAGRATRREVLELSLGAVAVLTAPGALLSCTQTQARPTGGQPESEADGVLAIPGPLTWDEFLAEVVPLAERSVRQGQQSEAAYLHRLSALAARSGWFPPGSFGSIAPRSGFVQRVMLERRPFVACIYELAAGNSIPAHDHSGYNGLFRVLRGSVTSRDYERVRGASSSEFMVRELEPQTINAGGMGVVSMAGANIHELQAGETDTTVLDLFTFYDAHGHSRPVEIDPPDARESELRRARWGRVV